MDWTIIIALGAGLGFAIFYHYLEARLQREQCALRHERETAALRILTDGIASQNELTRMLMERVFKPVEMSPEQTREARDEAREEEQTHEARMHDAAELLEGIAADGVDVTGVA